MLDDPLLPARTLVGVLAVAALTTGVLWGFGVPHRFAPAGAIARGAAQLTVIRCGRPPSSTHGWRCTRL
ncbi:hypothetical protein [Rhodococcus chondri]|uniref:Uncharacterized protein n=1 Tax=Rhodococcus chondri TaxID=3065941 RepID=A0ABU7JW94_9NOCA|nr:hypothetical protein [Rhodococcus sp. CC-R104]MEE2034275.1 hypothetical protein [Rhodococcus sp. CC-R104]